MPRTRKKRKQERQAMKYLARAAQGEIDRRAELQAAIEREGIRLAAEAAGWPLSTAALMIARGVTARGALLAFLEASGHVH
jgi:hypothetical protein